MIPFIHGYVWSDDLDGFSFLVTNLHPSDLDALVPGTQGLVLFAPL
jgi:hypothetical protein